MKIAHNLYINTYMIYVYLEALNFNVYPSKATNFHIEIARVIINRKRNRSISLHQSVLNMLVSIIGTETQQRRLFARLLPWCQSGCYSKCV